MKAWFTKSLLVVVMASAALPLHLFADQTNEEQQLIQILQSGASPAEKDAACARLKRVGSARSVPALAALLHDDQLSHSARYALESMQSGEAESALIGALTSTEGLTRVGLINSLAVRRDPQAVPPLATLLRDPDDATRVAAAKALGQIGGPPALAALQESLNSSAGATHVAVVDALLRCGNDLMKSGMSNKALGIFEKLDNEKEPDFVRQAAYRGIILASGTRGINRATRAILKGPGPSQAAALQLVPQLEGEHATKEFCRLLPKLKPEVQIALVGGLEQRGDRTALHDLRALAPGAAPELRPALLSALGHLGNAEDIPLLSGFAASGNAQERSIARRALSELRGANVTDTLLAQLSTAPPPVQVELARALTYRADPAAVPKLLELAAQPSDSVRKASLNALSQLIPPEQVTSLVNLVLSAPDATARQEASEALSSAYQRFQARRGAVPAAPLVTGLQQGSPEARAALLGICGGLVVPELRLSLRAALTDPNPQVRTAAAHALCDTVDVEMLDDLVNVARLTKEENLRNLAFRGSVRLVTQEESVRISHDRQVTVLKSLLNADPTAEQKRILLAGLAEVPTEEALGLVDPLLQEESVRNEAARAAVKIGLALHGQAAQSAIAVLRKALDATSDPATHQAVAAALKQLETVADYITDWQLSGPYRQPGKDYSALFDMVFPPEMGDGGGAAWKVVPAAVDPARPWVIDLLKGLGGEQCVGYARTWVHSDQEQPVRLEMGADDGIKVWLNSKQVYALNTARPLQPGSDKVDLTLNSGWNLLLLKITQNNQGWEFCARFLKPDGSHVEGLRCGSSMAVDSNAGH